MFELVHTSSPTGLLPGTHGFATVAMTAGLPDFLRRRLESLSAYRHLYSVNDLQYLKRNPIAWSHLILPSGEHVLSHVAASAFDYTGRTNRLARHFCFTGEEFSSANGADALLQRAPELSRPWQGLPRWLQENPAWSFQPRNLDLRPGAWIRLFGEEKGARLAAGFAVLLAERIQGDGRPVVFRDTLGRDPDASILLQLFRDIIALLPENICSKATFSTYPTDLPAGISCLLQGAWLEDDSAAPLSDAEPGLDLVDGRIFGENALPRDNLFLLTAQTGKRPSPVYASSAPIGSEHMPRRNHGKIALKKMESGPFRNSRAYAPSPSCIPSQSNSPNRTQGKKSPFYFWMIPIALFAVCAAVFYFFSRKWTKSETLLPETIGESPSVSPSIQDQILSVDDEIIDKAFHENEKKLQEGKETAIDRAVTLYQEYTRKCPSEKQMALSEEFSAFSNRIAGVSSLIDLRRLCDYERLEKKFQVLSAETEKAPVARSNTNDADRSSHPKPPPVRKPLLSFTEADKIIVNKMPGHLDGYWYYDRKGQLVFHDAKPSSSLTHDSPCVLGYDEGKGILYWQWKIGRARTTTFKDDADSKQRLNLVKICFGDQEKVFATWRRLQGIPSYRVIFDWKGHGPIERRYELTHESPILTIENLTNYLDKEELEKYRSIISDQEKQLGILENYASRSVKKWKDAVAITNQLAKMDEKIKQLETEKKGMEKSRNKKGADRDRNDEQIAGKKGEIKKEKKARKAFLDEAHLIGENGVEHSERMEGFMFAFGK